MPIKKGKNNRYVYENPKDLDGTPYWVSTVEKNKDRLVGFVEGLWTGFNILEENIYYEPSLGLSSERYTDITAEGKSLSILTKEELREFILNLINDGIARGNSKHPENKVDMSEYFYYASCSCGMMYSWKEAVDIPEKDFCCSCCGRKVIEYIDAEDRDIDYVGLDREVFDELMTDIRAYLGL